jgi:hypothetical protein
MRIQMNKFQKVLALGISAILFSSFASDPVVSAPLKRGSTGPTSQPSQQPPQPPKEVKQEESGEYVYRDTRMIRLPILPPFPIF